MKRVQFVPLLALAIACGQGNRPPPPQARIALPSGALLKPYDDSKPGEARPLYTAQLGGRVYAGLSNARAEGNFVVTAGPGFLAAIEPFAGTVDLIDLGGTGAGRNQCTNPGVIRADSGKLYVVCSGAFDGASPGRGLFEVDPATRLVSRALVTPAGMVPSGVGVAPTRIWVGDSFTPQLISVNRTTFTVVDGADSAHPPVPVPCPSTGQFPYVPYVGVVNDDVYALCATSEAGILARFDGSSGLPKGHVAVGASPTQFTGTVDGRIAVVNSLDNTLSLVTTGSTLAAQVGLVFKSPTSTLQDVKSSGRFVFTTASGSNTVQKIDLQAAGGPKVVAEASTEPGLNPYNLEPLDDDTVVVVNYKTSDVVAPELKPVP
jgi:hypothetical protein